MASAFTFNRPFKSGANDRREFIFGNETAKQMENDANGNVIYFGNAKPGSDTADAVWQIMKLTYDANSAPLTVTWPQDTDGHASTNYEYSWSLRGTYTYS